MDGHTPAERMHPLVCAAQKRIRDAWNFRMQSIRERCAPKTQSPIELMLFQAICIDQIAASFGNDSYFCALAQDHEAHDSFIERKARGCESVTILVPQYQVGDFRADMVIWRVFTLFGDRPTYSTQKLAIECDGHDFHERTREQAMRDKARDRAFALAGFAVMRFTGSEIWRDPARCVGDVVSFLDKDEQKIIDREFTEDVRRNSERH